MNQDIVLRQQLLQDCKRLVLKVGTRLIVDREAICRLIRQVHRLREDGCQVVLISSGAVGMGMRMTGLSRRPRHLSEVQALAAIGQVKLMALYQEECEKYGFRVAQLLLTADDLRARERHLNTINCIEALLAENVLPIINENDPVSVNELRFGDNDTLASCLGSIIRADLTIILTTVNGLMKTNPDGSFGDRISVVRGVTDEMRGFAAGTDDSSMSIGGMSTKLKAADLLNSSGEALWIASGNDPDILERIMAAEDVGTIFLPAQMSDHKLASRKRWIASFSQAHGVMVVDDGAARAIQVRGASLLPSGLVSATGAFQRGDVVEIRRQGDGGMIARGVTNFNLEDTLRLIGHKSEEIVRILGCDAEEELIHRNNLVLV